MTGGSGFSRRGFLSGLSVAAAGSALAACSPQQEQQASPSPGEGESALPLKSATVDFDGPHQAGISTVQQADLNLVGFRILDDVDREGLIRLLRSWTEDARMLSAGETPPGSLEPELTQAPANLTISCGFGPRVFDIAGVTDQAPEWLRPIPEFSLDELDPQWGQTDLVLQICADDPLMVSHATRHMIRSSPTYVSTAWMQQGFLHAAGSREKNQTPRNLFGQLDGTNTPRTDEEQLRHVWQDDVPEWAAGGTAMVVRRIRMNMDTWEMLGRDSREESVGRTLDNGAPLTGTKEFDDPDYTATDEFGLPVIDPQSHMARARAPEDHPEQEILRRPYNYDLPPDLSRADGQLSNSGQIFICFQKNPDEQFTPIQRRLDEGDRLNEWITHIGSALYWMPPGTGNTGDEFWGQRMLELRTI